MIERPASGNTPRLPHWPLRLKSCGVSPPGLVDGVSHGRALPLSPDLAAVPSRLLQVPFGDDRAGAVIVPGEKLKLRGLQPPTYDQSGTSGRGTRLEVRPRGPGTSAHRTPRAPPTGTSQTLHKTFHRKKGPKVGGKSMPKVDVSSALHSCGRALPNALVEPDGLLRPLLRTPTPRCSGPREPGVAAASTARRGRFERPRRALAPRPPRPPELRGACGRAACAPRLSARRRLSSVTAEPRAPPNPQESERAKACRARQTR